MLAAQHAEDLARHERGDRAIDVGNVRELTSERIAELGEQHGTMRATAAIAAAAATQLQSIKLTTATLPSGVKLHRVGDDSHLSADDCDWLNTRALRQAQVRALVHETSVRETLLKWIRELCGDHYERSHQILKAIGKERIDALLRVHKKERRAALARVLEEIGNE